MYSASSIVQSIAYYIVCTCRPWPVAIPRGAEDPIRMKKQDPRCSLGGWHAQTGFFIPLSLVGDAQGRWPTGKGEHMHKADRGGLCNTDRLRTAQDRPPEIAEKEVEHTHSLHVRHVTSRPDTASRNRRCALQGTGPTSPKATASRRPSRGSHLGASNCLRSITTTFVKTAHR